MHTYVSVVAMFACWILLAAPYAAANHRRELVILAVGATVGLGALNEVVEFLATLAHHGGTGIQAGISCATSSGP